MRAAFSPRTFRVTAPGIEASPSTASVTAPGKCPSKCGKSEAQKSTSSPIERDERRQRAFVALDRDEALPREDLARWRSSSAGGRRA